MMDINNLNNALDNDKNESIMGLTTKKILDLNLKILKELHLGRETTVEYLKKLNGYRYVDEIKDRLELISSFDSFNIVKKLQLENVDKLLDIVIDLTIINEDEYGEGRKLNKVTRGE